MVALEGQELELFLPLLFVNFGTLNDALLCSRNAHLELKDLVLLADAFILLAFNHLL